MKNKNKDKKSLIDYLKQLKDFRRKQGQRFSLELMLIIILMAIMNGSKSERSIARFAENNKKELIKRLKISRKQVPSRSSLKRTIEKIDFKKLEEMFYQWSLNYVKIDKNEWISVDGKSIKGTVTNPNNSEQNFTSLVSLFASKRKQNLKVSKFKSKKESEIPVVQELIKMLDLEGITFTLDALHCQKETTKTIKKSKNNYVIGVKGNQENLFNQVKKIA